MMNKMIKKLSAVAIAAAMTLSTGVAAQAATLKVYFREWHQGTTSNTYLGTEDLTTFGTEPVLEVSGVESTITYKQALEKAAAQTKYNGKYSFVWDKDHAEELAQYAEQVFTDINALSDIPEEKKVSVYFGNGEDSLETAPRGSQHAQILDAINAVNVADLELGDGSRVQISAEQLLAWDPDVIVVNGEPKADKSGNSAAEDILSNPDYASLKAVQDQKVYGTPNAPFSWVDRPAGPNRLIGMRWFSALIYPEYIKCDINEEIHKFFDLFYHVDLSDEQLENVLKGTL